MKATEKIIIAGVVGTTFMTLYSYIRSRKEHQQYVEPVMINRLIDNSANLPNLQEEKVHPYGYVLHYATGVAFVAVYYLLWQRALRKPNLLKIMLVGALSGLAGIAAWKLMFAQHRNAPQNYRRGYYRQLFIAHLIFTLFAIPTYRLLGGNSR